MTESGITLHPCEKLNARITRRQCLENMRKALKGHPGYRQTCLNVTSGNTIIDICPQGKEALAALKTDLEGESRVASRGGPCINCGRINCGRLTRKHCPACYRLIDDPAGLAAAKERLQSKTSRQGKGSMPPASPALPSPAPPTFLITDEITSAPGSTYATDH